MPNIGTTQTTMPKTQQQLEAEAAARRAQQQAVPTGTGLTAAPTTALGAPNVNGGGAMAERPPADPVNVATPNPDWGNFDQFGDAVYNDATRHLDPQWQQQEAQFRQQMVNQGLTQGSEAYNHAWDDFSRARNDAYGSARNSSLAQALAAQQQFFGQNLSQSELANALARANIAADAQTGSAQIGANASNYNSDNARMSNQDQLALQRELGLGDLGLRADQFGMQQNQQDYSQMMGLLGLDMGVNQYNNGLLNSDFARGQGLLGLIPNAQQTNIDVMGPYSQQYQGQMNAYNQQQQNNNANNAALGGLGSAAIMALMLCDREVKVPLAERDANEVLESMKSVPVELWRYRWESKPHIGTYAQDWNRAMGLPEKPYIDPMDMFGALLASVKALLTRVESLEAAHV